ncbi:unnamed protein product [Schistosoma margrebowiei]|uniref:Uncharacterized protein n=1 Tax=Schistosoma margrebowiei TaxID=48269 RepID=A0A3P7YWK6_9TREM|nr:unnamed protein product [Schistosoma margrebowiei]
MTLPEYHEWFTSRRTRRNQTTFCHDSAFSFFIIITIRMMKSETSKHISY